MKLGAWTIVTTKKPILNGKEIDAWVLLSPYLPLLYITLLFLALLVVGKKERSLWLVVCGLDESSGG